MRSPSDARKWGQGSRLQRAGVRAGTSVHKAAAARLDVESFYGPVTRATWQVNRTRLPSYCSNIKYSFQLPFQPEFHLSLAYTGWPNSLAIPIHFSLTCSQTEALPSTIVPDDDLSYKRRPRKAICPNTKNKNKKHQETPTLRRRQSGSRVTIVVHSNTTQHLTQHLIQHPKQTPLGHSPPGSNEARVSTSASLRAASVELSSDPHVRQASSQGVLVHEDVLRLHVAVHYHRLTPRPGLRLVQVLHISVQHRRQVLLWRRIYTHTGQQANVCARGTENRSGQVVGR